MKEIATYLILLFIAVFGTLPFSTASAPDDINIGLNTSTSQVTIGDSLSIFCTVTVPGGIQVSEPYLRSKSPFFDIEKQWKKTESVGPEIVNEHYGFLVYAFAPDTLHVGPFTVQYITAEGDTGSVQSGIITLPITGVVENPESPPLPNRKPFEIAGRGIPLWIIIAVISLIIIAVLAVAYFIYRKKKSLKPVFAEPIDEIGEFERIRAMKLHESGRLKELYFFISMAMRGFIHRKMEFDAMYETTYEIMKNLARTSENEKINSTISEILEESDRVKFAKYIPGPELYSSLIDRAIEPVKAVLDEIERKKEAEASAAKEAESKTLQTSAGASKEQPGKE